VGIGDGVVAGPLSSLANRLVHGVDVSPTMVTLAQERLGDPSLVHLADGDTLPFEDGTFENIYSVWVLQLVPDVRRHLRESRRVLRPAGRYATVLAKGAHDMEEIQAVNVDFREALGLPELDSPARLFTDAGHVGFGLVHQGHMTQQEWDESPNQVADRIEHRTYAVLMNLDDATFDKVARPVINRIRGLPDPDRPRRRVVRHTVMVFDVLDPELDFGWSRGQLYSAGELTHTLQRATTAAYQISEATPTLSTRLEGILPRTLQAVELDGARSALIVDVITSSDGQRSRGILGVLPTATLRLLRDALQSVAHVDLDTLSGRLTSPTPGPTRDLLANWSRP
jgi:SAM-dependent methyltransferase